MNAKVEELKKHLYQVYDIRSAAAVLEWDQQILMPAGGATARGEQVATLSALAHEIAISEKTGRLLEAAEAEVVGMAYDSDDASLVRVLRRDYDRNTKIPTELVAERAKVTAMAYEAWKQARAENNVALFEPHLERVMDVIRRVADALGYEEHPYDALLQNFEPGMRTSQVTQLFEDLKAGLVPLLKDITERGKPIDDSFLSRDYDVNRQWDFTLVVLRDIGYDFNRGRQDQAPHPFTTTFACDDVRLTTRLFSNRPQSAIFSSVHEGGHALYEQGSPAHFDRTALAGGATMALHESQSRLWENMLGRSKAFWQHYFPILKAFFPKPLADVNLEQFYRAVNVVRPDFIRVEADEVTYNMHIFVRFELEQALLAGTLAVKDVPEAWNAKYQDYLGITPRNDAEGCLQDVHWCSGLVGYFPTYALGNLIGAQLYRRMKADLPDAETGFARGEFLPLLAWMRGHVHGHGAKFTAAELLERELGEEISAQPLLEYMRDRYSEIYAL
ncbi:MAG: carboxypeptidase M32 [Anaerolineae bacterium]|jgi:carboxypeptidase Taq|nr:carboxypeptidase M32 [Anaerolineae bacterium]